MMLLERVVTYNIIINQWVTLWTEVPWLILWVVRSVFETGKFIFEIEHVICLFVSQGIIFVFGQCIDKCLLLNLFSMVFSCFICIYLRDWVVPGLLCLNKLICHFHIRVCFSLELSFGFNVVFDWVLPYIILFLLWKEYFIWSSLCYFLILGAEEGHIYITYFFIV